MTHVTLILTEQEAIDLRKLVNVATYTEGVVDEALPTGKERRSAQRAARKLTWALNNTRSE